MLSKSAEEQHKLRKKRAHEFLVGYLREKSGLEPERYFKSLLDRTKLPHLNKHKQNPLHKEGTGDKTQKSNSRQGKEYQANMKEAGSKLYLQEVDSNSTFGDESDTEADRVTLPPIREGISEISQSVEIVLNDETPVDNREESDTETKSECRTKVGREEDHVYIPTGHSDKDRILKREQMSHTASVSHKSHEKDLADEMTKLKYKHSISSAQNSKMIQSFLRHSSRLQSSKSKPDSSPRCHTRARACDVSSDVMKSYETHRGLTSRNYAVKCLNLATSFTEKPWLHQVRQATAIANQGVRKTLEGKPHLFMSEMEAKNTRDKYGLPATPRANNPIPV